MGFFNTGEMPQSEPAADSNDSPVNPLITVDVDAALCDLSLPSVDAEVRIAEINLPSVDANVSLLAGDCDGSGQGSHNIVGVDNLLDVHAPGLLEVTVGAENGTSDCSDGIHVEALNGDHLLAVHAPGLLDATIGGSELGHILGGSDCGPSGVHGEGIQVELLNGDHVAEAHVPGVADVTVGSGASGGLLHGLDDIGG